MSDNEAPSYSEILGRYSEKDREQLGQSLRYLLANGAILGLEPAQSELYHWSHQNRDLLGELAGLLDFKLYDDHQERTMQAVPQSASFLLHLKLDASLVLLTLWYEFDTAVRDQGETPPITLSVQQLNDSLSAKFEPLRKHMPSQTRLREILSLAQRKSLVRFTFDPLPERFLIQILPTLKRVIPFADIEDWGRSADRYLNMAQDSETEIAEIGERDGNPD